MVGLGEGWIGLDGLGRMGEDRLGRVGWSRLVEKRRAREGRGMDTRLRD